MDVVAQLEALVERAGAERVLVEAREHRLRALLAGAAEGRAASARERRALVDERERCDAALAAGRDRLGPARLAHGKAERELEALADKAAAGSDPAVRALGRASEAVETQAEIVQAHERRCRVLAAGLEAAPAFPP